MTALEAEVQTTPRGALVGVALYAAFLAIVLTALAPTATSFVDGNMYFEMTRQFADHATFEVDNHLDVVASPELWLNATVMRGRTLVAKYPPLHAVIASVPYRAMGFRGIIAVNALSVGAVVVAFFVLASRLLRPRRALAATILLPVCTPLVGYGIIEMPHALSAALSCWSIALVVLAHEHPRGARSVVYALGAGLLVGMAMGVRLQNLLVLGVLVVASITSRGLRIGALVGVGALPVLVWLGWLNTHRFGQANPFSYGPPGLLGSPLPAETTAHLLRDGGVLGLLAIGLVVAVAWRFGRTGFERSLVRGIASIVAAGWVLAVPTLRARLVGIASSACVLLLDGSLPIRGWMQPLAIHEPWIDRSLLQCSPFLALGLVGTFLALGRDRGVVEKLCALCVVVTVSFHALRDTDLTSPTNVTLGIVYSPRYLVELFSGLFLLSWWVLADVSMPGRRAWPAIAAGVAAAWVFLADGPGDHSALSRAIILYGSAALGLLLGWEAIHQARRTRKGVLVALSFAALGYAAASTILEDTGARLDVGQTHARWVSRVGTRVRGPAVIVGWGGSMQGVFTLRGRRDVAMVDAQNDSGADVVRVLDAFRRRGRVAYYFGLGLERVLPRLEGRYRAIPELTDPLLWRLEPVGAVH